MPTSSTGCYADADRLSNRVANSLSEHGIGHGDVVATFMYNAVEQALIWFGCAKIGAVYAALNVGCESRMAVMSAAWFVEFRQRLPWLLHVD